MKQSEEDPRLALRGRLIGLTGVLPTDPAFQEMSDVQMVFTVYWIEKIAKDRMEHLERILGTYWDVEMARSILGKGKGDGKKSSRPPTEIRVPLSMAANADMYKLVRETFLPHFTSMVAGGEYRPEKGEEIVEIDPDMDKSDFLQRIGYFRQAKEVMDREKEDEEKAEQKKKEKRQQTTTEMRKDLPPEMTAPLNQLFNLGTFSRGKDGGVVHKPPDDDAKGD